MPKKKFPAKLKPLPDSPEVTLNATEALAYKALLDQIRKAGNESATSVELLILAAQQKARMEKIKAAVDKLDSFCEYGASIITHPLVRELRVLESTYAQTLGKLLLTPRSALRPGIKKSEENRRDDDDNNPVLRAIS